MMPGVKTFVLRLYVPSEPEQRTAAMLLRGLVEEVGSGRHAVFSDGTELLAFLAAIHGDREPELSERSSS
jgi:hypothetical protein